MKPCEPVPHHSRHSVSGQYEDRLLCSDSHFLKLPPRTKSGRERFFLSIASRFRRVGVTRSPVECAVNELDRAHVELHLD